MATIFFVNTSSPCVHTVLFDILQGGDFHSACPRTGAGWLGNYRWNVCKQMSCCACASCDLSDGTISWFRASLHVHSFTLRKRGLERVDVAPKLRRAVPIFFFPTHLSISAQIANIWLLDRSSSNSCSGAVWVDFRPFPAPHSSVPKLIFFTPTKIASGCKSANYIFFRRI